MPLARAALATGGVCSPAKQILTITLTLKLWKTSELCKAIDHLRVRTGTLPGRPLENRGHPEWLITAYVVVSCASLLHIDGSMSR